MSVSTKTKASDSKKKVRPKFAVMVRVVNLWRIWVKPDNEQATAASISEARELKDECREHFERFCSTTPNHPEANAKGRSYEEIRIVKFL